MADLVAMIIFNIKCLTLIHYALVDKRLREWQVSRGAQRSAFHNVAYRWQGTIL